MKIYVPELNENACYVFEDTIILRKYDTTNLNEEINYTDYNTQNHYTFKSGKTTLTSVPACINTSDLTDEIYYRNDFAHIIIIFLLLFGIIIYFPFKLLFRFYGRGR